MAKISKFQNTNNLTTLTNEINILVYNEKYQLTWLIINNPISGKGNAIEIKNSKMKYLRVCGYPGGINSIITIVDGDINSIVIHDVYMFKDILRRLSDSMHNIAKYRRRLDEAKKTEYKTSPHYLIPHQILKY